ncbi:MAG: ATP-binding cassette domain-containing protein, partial [Mucinivorans sp.]
TTLIRIINRITAPDSGELLFDGRKMMPSDVARIGYLPEERGLYKKMKVGEQALYLSRLKGLSKNDAYVSLKKWFARFEIQGWWDKKVEELSKGMAQKVQFIVTVIHDPELLIFDEPFSGFDPINAELLKNEILDRARQGATVIFSTHNMASVEEICDHITLINRSRNILSGELSAIRHAHGDNTFAITFTGDGADLAVALERMGEVKTLSDTALEVTLGDAANQRELIRVVSDRVIMESFERKIPSMNEIFIKTVTNNG